MSDATVIVNGARPVLRFERFLPRPIGEVWRAVTDPTELAVWFPTRIEIDTWETGATLLHHRDGGPAPSAGKVLECFEPHRLVFTWEDNIIGFELTPAEGGTTFVLTQEVGTQRAALYAAGWEMCLEVFLDGAAGPESWDDRFQRYCATFETVLGAQQGAHADHDEP
jgi:uncharacterized protein YndB with AHSA1/START domain